ncbi:MAG: FxsA family protein, partial [Pseudomonadota bacterium]
MGRAGLILFAVFIVVPIAEIVLLAHVMGHIGILATIALIFATAIIGTFFIRQQGFGILTRATATMQKGGVAGLEIAEGGLLLFAGALLLTPGILTDAVGFLLLVPALRQPVAKFTMNRLLRAG